MKQGVDMRQFKGLPKRVDLALGNMQAVSLVNTSSALECSVIDVLDEWSEVGNSRDLLIRKAQVIARANSKFDQSR